jgi:hypothetical protein
MTEWGSPLWGGGYWGGFPLSDTAPLVIVSRAHVGLVGSPGIDRELDAPVPVMLIASPADNLRDMVLLGDERPVLSSESADRTVHSRERPILTGRGP